jgi:hypothetical protein
MILLISESNNWLYGSIAFFFLMLGISLIAYCIRTAECYEFDGDPIDVPGANTDISYEHQYN